MNQTHKSVYMYTHTHTHTHTINFVYLLRTSLRRCLQWVSAYLGGIRQWARGVVFIQAVPMLTRQSILASRPNGYWYCIWEYILKTIRTRHYRIAEGWLFPGIPQQKMDNQYWKSLVEVLRSAAVTRLEQIITAPPITISTVPDNRAPARGCA